MSHLDQSMKAFKQLEAEIDDDESAHQQHSPYRLSKDQIELARISYTSYHASQSKIIDLFLDFLFLFIVYFHVFFSPYNKVEESFNMQALHDLSHSFNPSHYSFDHRSFPGVVPRTFVGSLLLALIVSPLRLIIDAFPHPGPPTLMHLQIAYRLVLGTISVTSIAFYRRAVAGIFGTRCSIALGLLLPLAQFHLPFYCSRTLPNTFGMIATTSAFTLWLRGRPLACLALLTSATVLFRIDLIILLCPLALQMLMCNEVTFLGGLWTGILSGSLSLLCSLTVDSFYWGYLVWPEGSVLFFNTALDGSKAYGLSPWHWYFSAAIPKAMHFTLPMLLAGLVGVRYPSDSSWQQWHLAISSSPSNHICRTSYSIIKSSLMLFIHHPCSRLVYHILPALSFITLYSLLGHKELRFILPVFPVLTTAAAYGLSSLIPTGNFNPARIYNSSSFSSRAAKIHTSIQRLVIFSCILMLTLSSLMPILPTIISHYNYPGGQALAVLNKELYRICPIAPCLPIYVHIDVAACISGVSRFGELQLKHVRYNRTEGLDQFVLSKFDWRITSNSSQSKGQSTIFTIEGYKGGLPQLLPKYPFLSSVDMEVKFYIVKKSAASSSS